MTDRTDPAAPQISTIRAALDLARHAGVAAAEARLLLEAASGIARTRLLSHDEDALAPGPAARFADWIARRARGEPVAYLLGRREFMGLDFEVNDAVLIPRPETELLVEFACEFAAPGAAVLDLGTGSGAIAVSIAHARPDLKVSACDASRPALELARRNSARLASGRVEFVESDWFTAFAGQRFELIVTNPPYIAKDDLHLAQGDLRFEPRAALTDGGNGLAQIERIVDGAAAHLVSSGWIAIEHGYDQAAAVKALFESAGFVNVERRRDLAGVERVSLAQLRATGAGATLTPAARPRTPAPRTAAGPRASRRHR